MSKFKGVRMSFDESYKVDICYQVMRGDITPREASLRLGKSYRQTLRIVAKVQSKGAVGIKHGNYGKIPFNKSDSELKSKILKIYRSEYFDFNMTHFLEELLKSHGLSVAYETFRLWAHESNHVKRKHRKRKKPHPLRTRMARAGAMVQMDGSHHDWFGNSIKPVLIGCIDDATSECVYAEFFPAEDRISVMTVMQRVFERSGVPSLVYVDQAGAHGKAGIFRKFSGWQDHITDLERTLFQFGSRMIFATSPQGKGRIERMWNTFQDRLIPEIRRQKIKNIPLANDYLWQHFIPDHNKKFSVMATDPNPSWRVLEAQTRNNLDKSFYAQEFRKIAPGELVSMGGVRYVVEHDFEHTLEGLHIEIRTFLNGNQKLFYADREVFLCEKTIVMRAS